MDDTQVITLLRLCHQLSQIHEIPANHSYRCPTARMTHEVYKFHLGCQSSLDNESLTSLCEDFKTCYTCFVLSCKQSFSVSHPLIKSSGESYLEKLLANVVQFVQDIANEESENKRLVNVGKLCETIEKFAEILMDVRSFLVKELKMYQELMQSALDDLDEVSEEDLEFCKRFAGICARVLEGLEGIDERNIERIIGKCKEGSECFDNLVCCYLTGENEGEEVKEYKSQLTSLYREICELAGLSILL